MDDWAVQTKILITSTTWWPLAARLAAEFGALGAHVSAICGPGSPLMAVSSVRDFFDYSAVSPARSIAAAMRTIEPDLVVPCDERAVSHLHALHGSDLADDQIRALIERSIGAPAQYGNVLSRGGSMGLAASEGILEPNTRVLRSAEEAREWCTGRTLPALLKADGSWGGAGVHLVHSPEDAAEAYRRMARPIPTWKLAKFLLSNRDSFPISGWLHREQPSVVGQDFIKGRAANIMAACWQGEVLATAGAVVLETASEFGAATVIRPTHHAAMEEAARRLVRRIGMSGFCGLDFIIEDGTDKVWMIELNPRATQLGHLVLGPRGSLANVMLTHLRGETSPVVQQRQIGNDKLAFFPQAWAAGPPSALLRAAYHDIPWNEPALLAELKRRPWEHRSPVARIANLFLRRPDRAGVIARNMALTCPSGPSENLTTRERSMPSRKTAEISAGVESAFPTFPGTLT